MQLNNQAQSRQTAPSRVPRRHTRYLFSVPLTLRHLMPGGFHITHGMSVDISEGGISAVVEADLQVGETVEIDISLEPEPLNTVAILRHLTGSRSGFEFLGLTADDRQRITAASSAF